MPQLGNHKNAKKSCQNALFSSKTATESLKPYTVFCFDLQSCVKIRFYKIGCKYLTAVLTRTETRLKNQGIAKTKFFYKSLNKIYLICLEN